MVVKSILLGILDRYTIHNCWSKTGILPTEDVQIVEEPEISSDLMAELATLLTEFARASIPEVMEAQELLEVDCEVPTEAEAEAEEADASSDEEEVEAVAPRPVTLREARACMARVAEFMQVNSDSRGLARFVDVSIEMQSELDKTVNTASNHQVPMTQCFKPVPKDNSYIIPLEGRSSDIKTLDISSYLN